MPMPYSRDQHGPLHWPMPFPGVWLREDAKPGREAYWQLSDGELHATSYVRDADAEAFSPFKTDKGADVVWLDVAEPAGKQRLFRLDADGIMTGLDHWRQRL